MLAQPRPPGSACRTYATADTMALSSSTGIAVKAAKACNYTTATNELACTIKYMDNRSVSYTTVMAVKFASVADFVGDAPRISLFGSSDMQPKAADPCTRTTTRSEPQR
jgi:hypothetical protein